ncbi:RhoGAP-domain-containing protein [Hesseltinella vesiculosa]|uniref:RhoGAP-domain-containing protein n=1 Tax=Hesseltinella vesiculosa TaxID=101127 RepID=A0A1X2GL36_9FUNG|nr:RhoGAP-domain-containing protein [Hesseltinella vesiculosa]
MTEVVPPSLNIGPSQTDHLWKIIEKQRGIIQELQAELASVVSERDQLLKQTGQPSPPPTKDLAHYAQLALPAEPPAQAPAPLAVSTQPTSFSAFDMMFDTTEPLDITLKTPTTANNASLEVHDLFHDDTASTVELAAAMDEKDIMLYTKYHEAVRRKNAPVFTSSTSYAANVDGSFSVQSSLPPPPMRHGPGSSGSSSSSTPPQLSQPLPLDPILANDSQPNAFLNSSTGRTPRTPNFPPAPIIDQHSQTPPPQQRITIMTSPVPPTPTAQQSSYSLQRFVEDDEVPDPTVATTGYIPPQPTSPPALSRAFAPPRPLDLDTAAPANMYGSLQSPPPPNTPKPTATLDVLVKVISANMTTNEKGKVIFSFTVRVGKKSPVAADGMEPLWSSEKPFADFIALDQTIKAKQPSVYNQLLRLPDKSLFVSRAPAKVDERRMMVEQYLQRVLSLPLTDMTDLCDFLSTNVIEKHHSGPPKRKFGYLTKRGKNWGGWKLRFFVLDGHTLNYFESKGGEYLGSIQLPRAQIGRQVNQASGEDAYRHAFLILEPKKSAPQGVARHVLCADSDFERDQWVEAIKQYILDDDMTRVPPNASGSEGNDYREQLNKYLRRTKSDASNPKKKSHQRQRSSLDENDLKNVMNGDEDEKKKKSFWGKKKTQQAEVTGPTPVTPSGKNNPLQGLQGALSADQAAAIMNGTSILGFPDLQQTLSPDERGPKQVFGIPLDEAIQVSRVAPEYELPSIVYRCIEFLEAKDAAQEEGIYRLSGSAARIKKLKEKFNQEGDVQLLDLEEYNHEVHAIAGLLKMWFRELPGSVLTMELLNDFLQVADVEDRQYRTEELGRLVSMLPMSNYTLLRTLSAHLIRIVQNAGVNKMTLRNIGIVFSATLGIPAVIFNQFLSEFDYVFFTKYDPTASANPPTAPTPAPVPEQQSPPVMILPPIVDKRGRSNRNSTLYMGNAPKSIVGLERRTQGYTTIIEDDDEDNTLGLDHEELRALQQSRQQNFSDDEYQIDYNDILSSSPQAHTTPSFLEQQPSAYAQQMTSSNSMAQDTAPRAFTSHSPPPQLELSSSPQQLPSHIPHSSASPQQLSPHQSYHGQSRGLSPSPNHPRSYSSTSTPTHDRSRSPHPRSFSASPALPESTEYTAMVIEPSF